jgi:hypothetical protein
MVCVYKYPIQPPFFDVRITTLIKNIFTCYVNLTSLKPFNISEMYLFKYF